MPPTTPYLLSYADISWQEQDTPYAAAYDDVYWSSNGGAAEKEYVFLDACQLIPRWSQLGTRSTFTIAELGFGFGLNFLLTLKAWRASKPPPFSRLDFVSYEQHLVPIEAIEQMANAFGLSEEYELLKRVYPNPVAGSHILWLDDSCCLQLVLGDATSELSYLCGDLDAVFLDGFSPSRNDELWQHAVLQNLASSLRPGGLLSTYSAAGHLRRQLLELQLNVEKATGFANKRHMLVAQKPGDWRPKSTQTKTVCIVGAGLTGLFTASALEKRGYNVTLIDQNAHRHGAVTDIHQIAIYPQLSQTPQPYSKLYLRAFEYFKNHQDFNQCGRMELLDNKEKLHKAEMLNAQLSGLVELRSAAEASQILGLKVEHPGLFTQSAGWLAPQQISPHRRVCNDQMLSLTPYANGWELELQHERLQAECVILATGPENVASLAPLKLMALRGQSMRITGDIAPGCVFSHRKTWFPNTAGTSTVSGTYSRFDSDIQVRTEDEEALFAATQPYLEKAEFSSQVGIRSATRDRLPIVDRVPDWMELYQHLNAGLNHRADFTAYQPGLYCSVGFGSHAGTLGPYCAEVLARTISEDVQTEDLAPIASTRFAVRDARKS